MTRRDWWLGVALLAAVVIFAVVFPQLFPRYECHVRAIDGRDRSMRVDRWSGTATPTPYPYQGCRP